MSTTTYVLWRNKKNVNTFGLKKSALTKAVSENYHQIMTDQTEKMSRLI